VYNTLEENLNYTYLLRCSDGTYYCGWTNDLDKRLAAHNSGKGAKYTKTRRPVELVYYETFETKQEAMSREYHIKRLTRAEKEELVNSFGN
jgi:putative endonuclease